MAAAGDSFDVIVIGGGPPGENAAQYAAQGGLSTLLVERRLLGGECSYWACIPSKALLRPVEVMGLARALPGVAEAVSGGLDVSAVLERRDAFVGRPHDDGSQVEWAEGVGVEVLRGDARLDGERVVVVEDGEGGERRLTARHGVVLATGTDPSIPPVDGLAEARPWTSHDVTNLREVPRRVAIVGGGVVACEAACWLLGLGVEELTMIERGSRLLARTEPFAGEMVRDRLAELGADVRLEAELREVRRGEVRSTDEGVPRGAEATLVLGDGTELVVDEIVVAAGRSPNSAGLGLESVGLEGEGYVETDDHMAVRDVDGDWLYAVGDITGRALLTHMGKYQGRVCGDVLAARARGEPLDAPRFRATADHGQIPQVTFTDPQVASVGPTEEEAREAGRDVEAVDHDLGSISGASLLRDGYEGRARLVVDRASGTLVGATFVGPEVAELLHAATVAVVGQVPLETLWHAVPSFPTVSEVWLRLLEDWRERSR